ncbi:MFS general substrate transporter, partial [Aureobasidium melanogenum]
MRGLQSPFCNRPLRLLRNITAAALILCLVLYHIPDRTWRGARMLFFGAHWERFPLLDGYYSGVRSLVPSLHHEQASESFDQSRNDSSTVRLKEQEIHNRLVEYNPYHGFRNTAGRPSFMQECFLDDARTVAIPRVYSYLGMPQDHPDPLYGSYKVLGLRDDVCFDRIGRLEAYGSATRSRKSKAAQSHDRETQQSPINWSNVDWAAAQKRCFDDNTLRSSLESATKPTAADVLPHISRQAIVLRTWTGYRYTRQAIMNLRALISEVSLGSGGEYDVHLLVHVKNNSARFWESEELYNQIRQESVPAEFRGLVTLWSEKQMELVYPGPFCNETLNRSEQPIYGVYRSSHMPMQWFAQRNTQYEHFWNWEMDIRYIGHYYEFFDRLGQWAKSQPRRGIWERNAKYYFEKLHGTWAEFSDIVENENPVTVSGPLHFAGSPVLESQAQYNASSTGVGEDADLITMSPLFDPEDSGWFFERDVTGYDTQLPIPPRRIAIIAAARMSRQLLNLMHKEMIELKHTMWTEMWPPSLALHYGLKATFAPHPVYYDRDWPIITADRTFNAGKYGSSGGNASSVFGAFEHNFIGSTWYCSTKFAGDLWRAWLGRGSRENRLRNGLDQMCLRSMLLHAVKHENHDDNRCTRHIEPLTVEDDAQEFELTGFSLITVISGLVLAIFLVSLDSAIVATAIPYVTAEFKSAGDTAWYGSAYTLATCALQPIAGKLYAKFSIKTMFLIFMALFEIGSLVCATAPNAVGLIVGRAIAGAGAAGCTTGAFSIVAVSVRLPRRTTYLSALQSTFGIGIMLGPLLGGVLTQRVTWRWCFYINLPIGAVTVLFLVLFFHPPKANRTSTSVHKMASLDLIGLLLFAPATIMILLALQWGGLVYAWGSATIIGLFVGAAVLTAILAFWQRHKGDDAMIPPKLFTQRVVFFACLTELFAMGTVYVATYYLPQWFQIVKGVSPIRSGVMYLPLSMSDVASALVVGILLPYVGLTNPFILAGTTLLAVGSGLLSTLSTSSGSQYWIPYQILPGMGAGITLWMPYVAIQTVLKAEDIPVATALLQFFQSFGAALFLALAQAVFTSIFNASLNSVDIVGLDPSAIVHAAPADFRKLVPKEYLAQVLHAYNQGVTSTFYLGAGLAAAACFASFGIQWKSFKPKGD